jgi:hypothetical protein
MSVAMDRSIERNAFGSIFTRSRLDVRPAIKDGVDHANRPARVKRRLRHDLLRRVGSNVRYKVV